MSASKSQTTRRAFFIQGGATVGAGVAAAAGASHTEPHNAAAEREAIRKVHQAFIAAVENGMNPGAAAAHRAYRSNARQGGDQMHLSDDGKHAEALWHVDVKMGTPLEGDSTAAQMARLQGMLADMRWESGLLTAQYAKQDGRWQLSSVRYRAA
jgi:hypothetical protein